MKYLIFSLPRSGNEAKCAVEIRHQTRNASRIQQKVGNVSFNGERSILILGSQVPFAYPAMCRIQGKLKKNT